eukprot:TRINITY_DN11898_c0_g2_i4.p1 TRINITY_DN11898_c0_g2~~TRINITY_DN11898_c0_g2_i4.p1  ORF type:complete len:241 (+),score=58.08 TRINITY_DN11898_c0_g2_i4:79-723(+)
MGNCDGSSRGCCSYSTKAHEFDFGNSKTGEINLAGSNLLVKHVRSLTPIKPCIVPTADHKARLAEAVHSASVLRLKALGGREITVNALGAENSLRGAADGVTYFGCKKRSEPNGEVINDIVIKSKDKEVGLKYVGRHFQIQYSIEESAYKIKDLGVGFGTYVRLENPLALKDNLLISMGESFLIINLISEDKENVINKKLRIKVFSKSSNNEIL